jgi:hypothetical protein
LENEFAKNAVQKAKQSYGVSEPNHSVNVRQDQVRKHDRLLKFRLPNGTDLNWMHVDFIIRVSPSDKAAFVKGYPFQAVQPNEPRKYPPPPFKLDPAFRSAFKIAIKDFGAEQIESIESLHPPKKLLNLIAKNMRTVT